jgi:hypothetical protein
MLSVVEAYSKIIRLEPLDRVYPELVEGLRVKQRRLFVQAQGINR